MVGLREFISVNPFVKITPLFIFGILLKSNFIAIGPQHIIYVFIFVFIILSILFFINPINRKVAMMLFSITFASFMVLFGMVWSSINDQKTLGHTTFKPTLKDQWHSGIITEPLKQGKKFTSAIVAIKSLNEDNLQANIHITKAIVYLPQTKKTQSLSHKDLLIFKSKLKEIKGNENPYDFNFQKIYHPKGITHQTFVDSTQWAVSHQTQQLTIKDFANSIRKTYLNVLNEHIKDPTARSIAQSLILGERTNISKDTKTMFKEVGAMHLLAISGLHLGIIYLILTKCFSFLKKNRTQLLFQFSLVCTFLWSYALITGFSSSVVRAALMLTIFDLGRCFQKKT